MSIFRLLRIFSLSLVMLLTHSVLSFFNFYKKFPLIDIPIHFLFGFMCGICFSFFLLSLKKEKMLLWSNNYIFLLLIISFLGITVLTWEFIEFAIDPFLISEVQLGLIDTLLDMFLGILGGILGHLLHYKLKNIRLFNFMK